MQMFIDLFLPGNDSFIYCAPRRTPSHVLPLYFRVPKIDFQAAINLQTKHLDARRAHILCARGAHCPRSQTSCLKTKKNADRPTDLQGSVAT